MSSNREAFACSVYPSPGVGGEGPSPGALKARVVENLPFGAHDKERMHECNEMGEMKCDS